MKLKQLFMIWLMAGLMVVPSGLYLASLAHADGETDAQCTNAVDDDDEGIIDEDFDDGEDFNLMPGPAERCTKEMVENFKKECKGDQTDLKKKTKRCCSAKQAVKCKKDTESRRMTCLTQSGKERTYVCCCGEPQSTETPKTGGPKPNGNAADYNGGKKK
jgi:hypothetical protein